MRKFVLACSLLALTACAANRPAAVEAPVIAVPAAVSPGPVPAEAPVTAVPAAAGESEEAERRPLLSGSPNGGLSPAWSPDGSLIAFLSSTLHTPADLWVMNADGSGARRLTSRGVLGFRWSADGKSLTFTTRRKGFEEAMVIGLDGKGEKRIPGLPPGSSLPIYSPDGALFAFTVPAEMNVRDLWIGTADGSRIEAVTEKISVRNIVWSQNSRKVYYEAGKSYGVGIWEVDLSSMESKALLNKYIGTPVFSPAAGLFAFPYPVSSGVYEVHTMKPDGADIRPTKAPRLDGRWLAWDAAGKGVYYLGQDLVAVTPEEKAQAAGKEKRAPHDTSNSDFKKVGVTSIWRLDLETGKETRVSPANLHLVHFDISPGGAKAVVTGVLEKSHGAEIFSLDLASGEMRRLVQSRPSTWLPVPTHDASRIAFFTNEGTLDTLKVVSHSGDELAAYPGFVLEEDTRIFWLPHNGGVVAFSSRGIFGFNEKGPIPFPGQADHRAYLYADASIQEDKVLINTIPRYGQTQGLYMIEAVGDKFEQTDLRFPAAPEVASELYLQPRWSLDGKKIAFTDGLDVWTMNADGSKRTWVTNHAEERQQGRGRDAAATFPVWSVNGELICYILRVHEEKRILNELWVMKADGSERKLLFTEELDSQFQVFQPEYTYLPFFVPGDERIIFTVADAGIPNIYAVEVKSGKMHRLTDKGGIFPALLPEDDVIVYTSLEGNTESLWLMNTDGSEKRPFAINPKPAAEPVKEPKTKGADAKKAQTAEQVQKKPEQNAQPAKGKKAVASKQQVKKAR